MAWVTPTDVSAGSVLTASKWNQDVVENTLQLYGSLRRIAHQTSGSDYTISATSIATATDAFTDITWTAEAATYLVIATWPTWSAPTNGYNAYAYITDGGNNGIACVGQTADLQRTGPNTVLYFYTVTSGSKTINMRFTKESGTGNDGSVEVTAASGREVAGQFSLSLYGTVLS